MIYHSGTELSFGLSATQICIKKKKIKSLDFPLVHLVPDGGRF